MLQTSTENGKNNFDALINALRKIAQILVRVR